MKTTLKEFRELNNDEQKKLLKKNQNLTFDVPKINCTIDITLRQKDSIDDYMDVLIKEILDFEDRMNNVKL